MGYAVHWLDAVSHRDEVPEPPYGLLCRGLGWYIETDKAGTHLFSSEAPELGTPPSEHPHSQHRFFIAIPDKMIEAAWLVIEENGKDYVIHTRGGS